MGTEELFSRGPKRPYGQRKTVGSKALEGRSDQAAGASFRFFLGPWP